MTEKIKPSTQTIKSMAITSRPWCLTRSREGSFSQASLATGLPCGSAVTDTSVEPCDRKQ